jgi:hypothetical protein
MLKEKNNPAATTQILQEKFRGKDMVIILDILNIMKFS